MGKQVHKYNLETGKFVCTYKSIQQAANDLGLDESSVRKRVNNKELCVFKGCILSLLRRDSVASDYEVVEAIEEKAEPLHKAKILILDIETAPTIAGVWRFWKENVGYDQIFDESYILSYSCKWLMEPDVYTSTLSSSEAILNDDSRLLEELWEFLDEADIVIAYNGKYFDLPVINTRSIKNMMSPPSSYIIIDPLETVRRNFSFPSNKLGNVAKYLGLREKIENEGFNLWKKCITGDPEALLEMGRYNEGDVITLEDLYMFLRPYIKPHPNMGMFIDNKEVTVCPTCSSSNIVKNGYYYTPMNKYEEFRCLDCGSIGRSRFAVKKFKGMLSSVSH